MKKSRKYMAVYGVAGAAALTGLGIGMVLGPGSALADTNSRTSTTISTATTNATANRGTPPANRPSPGPRVDDLSIAAQTIGISEADLRSALQNGQSIADVAKAHNVDEQKVIDAISAADTKAIDQAVTDGKLTPTQADQMKSNLPAHVKDEVERTGMPGPGGHGPGGHGHGFGGPGGPGGQPPADGGSTSAAPTTGSTSA
jgi:hypothetical protein